MSFNNTGLPHLVFLHGWGQSSKIWHHQISHFLNVTHTIDLPGHGHAKNIHHEHWVKELEQHLLSIAARHPIILIGWSLGGQLAITLAEKLNAHESIKGLVLVSTTPCFRQRSDWKYGCSEDFWHNFYSATTNHDPKLMQRFFKLMLHGDILTREQRTNIYNHSLDQQYPPSTESLINGLNLLDVYDLRSKLEAINIPTLVVHGNQDAIIPVQASHYLSRHIQTSQHHTFQDCGHAPFLTQYAAFNQLLEQWWKNLSM